MFLITWQAYIYLTLSVFMGLRKKEISKVKESANISYLVNMIKTGQRSRTLDIATLNPKSGPLTTWPRLAQFNCSIMLFFKKFKFD